MVRRFRARSADTGKGLIGFLGKENLGCLDIQSAVLPARMISTVAGVNSLVAIMDHGLHDMPRTLMGVPASLAASSGTITSWPGAFDAGQGGIS